MEDPTRLGQENVSKLLWEFSVPAVVGMLVSSFYNVIDRVFIGNSVGPLGIAGITVGFPIMIVQMAFGMLVGLGATALVSIRLGQQRKGDAERIVGNAVVLLGIFTALITSSGLLFLSPLLRIFGASAAVLPYARAYMGIILFGSVFQTFSFGMNNFIRAEGKPAIAMATMLIGSVLNVLLAPLFIFVFRWGLRGAALATVISEAISATWIVSHFLRGKSYLRLRAVNCRLDPEIVRGILAIGVAPFAMQIAACFLSALLNHSLLTYGGDTAISGMGIVICIQILILMPVIGINQGAQPIIGYNYGARAYARVKATLKRVILVATAISTLGFLATRLFPSAIVRIFNHNDPALLAFGSHALTVFLFGLPLVGFQIVGAGYFQAVGKPRPAMFLSLSRQLVILVPVLLVLPRFLGLQGVLLAGPLADGLSAILTGSFLLRELARLGRVPEPVP